MTLANAKLKELENLLGPALLTSAEARVKSRSQRVHPHTSVEGVIADLHSLLLPNVPFRGVEHYLPLGTSHSPPPGGRYPTTITPFSDTRGGRSPLDVRKLKRDLAGRMLSQKQSPPRETLKEDVHLLDQSRQSSVSSAQKRYSDGVTLEALEKRLRERLADLDKSP